MAVGKSNLGSARGRGKIISTLYPLLEKFYPITPTPADIYLEDGDELQINGIFCKVIHTPGHTRGSCTYLIKDQYAFVGDLISNNGKPHIQKYFAHDWPLIPLSVQIIKSRSPKWTYAGHGKNPIKPTELQKL
jgi:glyoxylase-like metal-dependent hydrolase (beta-lactamase superfamily II)